jgi:hypothetical protein
MTWVDHLTNRHRRRRRQLHHSAQAWKLAALLVTVAMKNCAAVAAHQP